MQPLDPDTKPSSTLFTDPAPARSFPTAAVAIAAVAVIILVAALVLLERRGPAPSPHTLQPTAAYASSLPVSNLQMSESTSMSGGKQTYIEGHIANHGTQTVTGITVQVVFANDTHMAPQIETGPLNLIYMRQPYVDTRPVSASPIAPGAEADFRLIFDDVSDNWNQQLPEIRITQVESH
ncbi:DUF2393 family protein [Granulicella sp. L46]|uniref:DUF2393 family protein n=1 Tax=Granulicella sp. L46 TaxID=1641865 RepID=UPI00131D59FE|nr:DUF2393 family protein [Granulicella sp. L46]